MKNFPNYYKDKKSSSNVYKSLEYLEKFTELVSKFISEPKVTHSITSTEGQWRSYKNAIINNYRPQYLPNPNSKSLRRFNGVTVQRIKMIHRYLLNLKSRQKEDKDKKGSVSFAQTRSTLIVRKPQTPTINKLKSHKYFTYFSFTDTYKYKVIFDLM